jgi:hypothetical protein
VPSSTCLLDRARRSSSSRNELPVDIRQSVGGPPRYAYVVNRLGALIAIGFVAVTAAALVGVPDSQAVPLQPVVRSVGPSAYSSVPACAISELHVTYHGAGAAAGTGIADFEVSDISRHACVLLGTPTVLFFTGSFNSLSAHLTTVSRPPSLTGSGFLVSPTDRGGRPGAW